MSDKYHDMARNHLYPNGERVNPGDDEAVDALASAWRDLAAAQERAERIRKAAEPLLYSLMTRHDLQGEDRKLMHELKQALDGGEG